MYFATLILKFIKKILEPLILQLLGGRGKISDLVRANITDIIYYSRMNEVNRAGK